MPNLQNLPHQSEAARAIIDALTPKDNLVSADFTDIEEAILAKLWDDYFKRCIEADAAWEVYCSVPTDQTWARWVEIKQEERRLEAQLREICGEDFEYQRGWNSEP